MPELIFALKIVLDDFEIFKVFQSAREDGFKSEIDKLPLGYTSFSEIDGETV